MRILLATCLALVACLAPARAADAPLTVFAAASLKESMDEATLAFQRDTGQAVRVAYAGSSALARQIEQGAPADVFAPADLAWMGGSGTRPVGKAGGSTGRYRWSAYQ